LFKELTQIAGGSDGTLFFNLDSLLIKLVAAAWKFILTQERGQGISGSILQRRSELFP